MHLAMFAAQMASGIYGYFAVCLLAFTNSNGNGFGTLSFTLLIAYQLFWGLITMLLPNLRRY